MADIKSCFIPVLMWEGLVSENSNTDYGGYTVAGLSQKYWPDLDLWKLDISAYDKVAKEIENCYRKIWNNFRLSEINSNFIARQIFQAAFNCWNNSIKWAQQVCNEQNNAGLVVDGIMGDKTISAINSIPSVSFRKYFCEKQKAFYHQRELSALVAKDALEKKAYFNDTDKNKLEMEAAQLNYVKGWIARAEYFAK